MFVLVKFIFTYFIMINTNGFNNLWVLHHWTNNSINMTYILSSIILCWLKKVYLLVVEIGIKKEY